MPNNNMEMPPSPMPEQPEMPISNDVPNNAPEDIPNDLGGGRR